MSKIQPLKIIIVRRFSNGEMMVELSTHLRFVEGTRFDFGYINIAMHDGYIIEIHPDTRRNRNENPENKKVG